MVSKIFYEKIEEIYILCLLGEVFCRTKLMCMNTMKLNNLVFDLCIVALKKRKKEGGVGWGKEKIRDFHQPMSMEPSMMPIQWITEQ